MKNSAYGNPLYIKNNQIQSLSRDTTFNEAEIQNLIFSNPQCLPLSDIDESYNPLIPVCMEMSTPAGPMDILMITPNGDIAIIETKLWVNPEARRKVIAQILDYAKELAKWSYSDLQREVNRRLNTKGNYLYELSTNSNDNYTLSEMDFVDAVSRNLRHGKFLLLVVGDGIREGAIGIADFLTRAGNLNFGLAMIELSVYKTEDGNTLLIPRTNVKTVEVQKINIEIPEGMMISSGSIDTPEELDSIKEVSKDVRERRRFFTSFWTEFIDQLVLDDPEQDMPLVSKGTNIYLYPGSNKSSWISAYMAISSNKIGVYYKFHNNQRGYAIKEYLSQYLEQIKDELDDSIGFNWDSAPAEAFYINMKMDDITHEKNKQKIMDFFAHWINHFVNVLRPKLKSY